MLCVVMDIRMQIHRNVLEGFTQNAHGNYLRGKCELREGWSSRIFFNESSQYLEGEYFRNCAMQINCVNTHTLLVSEEKLTG